METAIGFILLALLIGGFIGSAFTTSRQPKRLESGARPALPPPEPAPLRETSAAPEPPRPPSFDERLRAVGIRLAALEELGLGPDEYVIWEDRKAWKYERLFRPVPRMLGWVVALGSHHALGWPVDGMGRRFTDRQELCSFCRSDRTYRLYRIVKREVPPGAQDLGLVETRMLCDVCAACGFIPGKPGPELDEVFGGLYLKLPNFKEILAELEKRKGGPMLEWRLRVLKEEHDALRPRADALADEIRRLEAEIPHPELDPYRGTPLAKLDDPPDDRAKAMPALDDDPSDR